MREFNYGYGVVTQNFLMNYFLFNITLNPCKKAEFLSEKQKDMSDDGLSVKDSNDGFSAIVGWLCYIIFSRHNPNERKININLSQEKGRVQISSMLVYHQCRHDVYALQQPTSRGPMYNQHSARCLEYRGLSLSMILVYLTF